MAKQVPARNGGTLTRPDKGETMNPNGRPPKLLSSIVKELRAKGYERATATTVCEAFEILMNVPQEILVEMTNDKEAPMSIRIVGKAMLSAKGWEVLSAILDRAHGKAVQQIIQDNKFPDAEISIQVVGEKPKVSTSTDGD
ncbi:hypothetical protein KDA23_06010 [Candidatus Saccharibacteria bacterium]|nr:hypothetical protein [Candidatus Saccharibacteria bacterium]